MQTLTRSMKKHFLLAATALILAATATAQTEDRYVRKADYTQAEKFSASRISRMVYSTRIRPSWFRDSDKFWYSWKTADGTHYYIVDPATGAKDEIFDMDRLAMQLTSIVRDPFDRQNIPMRELKLVDDKYFTFNIQSTAEETDSTKFKDGKPGKKKYYFKYDIASRNLSLTEEEKDKYPEWANVSPDGKVGIYTKNHNLYWMDADNMAKAAEDPKDTTLVEHAITTDGTRNYSYHGGNYTGDTESDTTARHFASVYWSPDSRRFATIKWDMSDVKELWVINTASSPRPTLETYHYQMPGEPSPSGKLLVFSNNGSWSSHEIAWNAFKYQDGDIHRAPATAQDNYKDYNSLIWLGDNNGFYLQRMSRDLKRTDLCYVGVDSDSTRTVVSERLNTYVETRDPVFLKNGRQFIWWSERNGWANLYLYNTDGTLVRNLTDEPFHVEDVLAVNQPAGYVLFNGCGRERDENPYQMHNFKVSLSGGKITRLDMDDMDVLAAASDNGRYFVANYSRVDAAPAVALYNAQTGRKVTELEKSDLTRLFAAGYKFPERFKVKAADGITDLWGVMYKPFDFDSTKVYPICDYVYPGPQVEANNISWTSNMVRVDRLAQLGFIVITVGNRGGHPNRSKWYHNYGYGNLRDYGLEDQKYAIQQLADRHSFIDINRVGIHGHSGGGFMSTAAILKYPDFFKAAVSCAGNHDNSIYNRWWSEQHHGILEKVSQGDTTFVYHIDTNQEIASRLKGHLMLVHGDMDNNVHPANSIRVVDALIRANKRFEFVYLPGQRHGFGEMNEYFFWKMADHYTRYLMGDTSPRPIDIPELNNN